jgi:rhodanese-related sulfurtransferase
MKKTAKALVDEAMAQVTTYTVEQARALHGHPGVQFVDVRDIRELEHEGVVPGALHAPRGMLEFWVDPDSPYHRDVFAQDKEYVLFCALGWRSALATKTLMDMGLERVAHVEGGFKAWKEAGAPVEAKKPKA